MSSLLSLLYLITASRGLQALSFPASGLSVRISYCALHAMRGGGSGYSRVPSGAAEADAADGPASQPSVTSELREEVDAELQEPSSQSVPSGSADRTNLPTSSGRAKAPRLHPHMSDSGSSTGLASILQSSNGVGRCRVCLDTIGSSEFEDGTAVHLGCACLGDLAIMHLSCAEKWFG